MTGRHFDRGRVSFTGSEAEQARRKKMGRGRGSNHLRSLPCLILMTLGRNRLSEELDLLFRADRETEASIHVLYPRLYLLSTVRLSPDINRTWAQ
jgi:hypothetical protein